MANYRRPVSKPAPPETCLMVDELCIWGTDPDTCSVSYMGYPLLLSPAETRLLLALVSAATDGISSVGGGDEADAAVRMCVKRINDKARDVSGREIVVRDRRGGYRLNPHM